MHRAFMVAGLAIVAFACSEQASQSDQGTTTDTTSRLPESGFTLDLHTSVEFFDLLYKSRDEFDRWCRGWEGRRDDELDNWRCSLGRSKTGVPLYRVTARPRNGNISFVECVTTSDIGAYNAAAIVGFYFENAVVPDRMAVSAFHHRWEGFTGGGEVSREDGAIVNFWIHDDATGFSVITAREAKRRQ